MKLLISFLILNTTTLSFSQKLPICFHALDDASDLKQNFKTLFTYDEYRLDEYGDTLKFVTDTNFIKINGVRCSIKDSTGKTTIIIIDTRTNKAVFTKSFSIINKPFLIAKIDKKLLLKRHILKSKLVDENGKNVSRKYYYAFFEYKLINNENKKFYIGLTDNYKTSLKSKNIDFNNLKKIFIIYRIIYKKNGLNLYSADSEEVL